MHSNHYDRMGLLSPQQVTRAVATNLRRLRHARKLTLQQVAERLENTGHSIGLNALSKIERGSRRLTVADLAALSQALDVADPWDLVTMPSCDHCHGAAPAGYACLHCGTGATP